MFSLIKCRFIIMKSHIVCISKHNHDFRCIVFLQNSMVVLQSEPPSDAELHLRPSDASNGLQQVMKAQRGSRRTALLVP